MVVIMGNHHFHIERNIMIEITSDTFDDSFCKIIENNVNFLIDLYNKFGFKVWLIPLYPLERKQDESQN